MPFLFWWNTWFGRHLSDQQIEEYLHDAKHPRHIQHALVQIGERMGHGAGAAQWYPELIPLAAYPVEEVRNTDAWVMGQDSSYAGFHAALSSMLQDSSAMVRGNAALSLVRFGDASGRTQILALLLPAKITAPVAGRIIETGKVPRWKPQARRSSCALQSLGASGRFRSQPERTFPQEMKWQAWIPQPNKCGKRCARFI